MYDGIKDDKAKFELYRHISILNSDFLNSHANNSGGALFLKSGKATLLISKCNFVSNTANMLHGAVSILMDSGVRTTLEDCTFDTNQAEHGDGGALAFDVDVSIDESFQEVRRRRGLSQLSFDDNNDIRSVMLAQSSKATATTTTTTTTTRKPTAADSPTMHPTKPTTMPTTSKPTTSPTIAETDHRCANISIANCTFSNNKALRGKGGGMYVNVYKDMRCVNWNINNSTFLSNQALYGGGLALLRQNQSTYHEGEFILY
ncbi:hypothetical protein RFI_17506, partial [Reticulomyxa filosa]